MSDAPNYLQHIRRVATADGQNIAIDIDPQGAMADAFGRARVSNPVTLFDSALQYNLSPLLWESSTPSGTVTHLPNESSARLRITGPSQQVIRQTRQYFRYQPGKSQKVQLTFNIPSLADGVTREIGYFDGENGIFLRVSGQSISFVLRSNTSGTPDDSREFFKGSWSTDNFNGQGPSKKTLDITKAEIFLIDLEWLGVGRVRVGFVIDGAAYWAHSFNNANILTKVYMTTANLPLRYEIRSDATAAAGNHDLIQICNDLVSEGADASPQGIPFMGHNASGTTAVTTRRPLLSVRPKATFNSIVNRGTIVPEFFEVVSVDALLLVEVVFGGTLTGANFVSAHDESIAEVDIAASAISGGVITGGVLVPASSQGNNTRPSARDNPILSKLPLALDIAGNHPTTPYTDCYTLVATSLGGSTATAALTGWRELR